MLVAPGTVIPLTKGLLVCEKKPDWQESTLAKYHCKRRPSGPRAALWAGAERRVWAVGAQAWSAPR